MPDVGVQLHGKEFLQSGIEAILGELLLRLCLGVALCSARATKVEVIAAVTIARNAIPSSITNAPTNLPVGFVGVTSPYPGYW